MIVIVVVPKVLATGVMTSDGFAFALLVRVFVPEPPRLMLASEPALAPDVDAAGVRAVVTDTIMRDQATRRALAQATLDAVLR